MSDNAPSKGRRLWSTYGLWRVPYVDEARLVFRTSSTGPAGPFLTPLPFLGEILACAGDGWGTLISSPAWLHDAFFLLGFVSAIVVWGHCLGAPFRALYRTRIAPIKTLLVERTGEDPVPKIAINGARVSLRAGGARSIVRASVLSQKYVFLVLGDYVFELWRSEPVTGANARNRDSDWSEERLVGGEGSPALGQRTSGRGSTEAAAAITFDIPGQKRTVVTDGTELLVPVLDALRGLLGLSERDDIRINGPELGIGEWAALHGVGIVLAGLGALVHWKLSAAVAVLMAQVAPGFALSEVDPLWKGALFTAIGTVAGLALAAIQWLVLRAWLKSRVVVPIDDFAVNLIQMAAPAERLGESAPFREASRTV